MDGPGALNIVAEDEKEGVDDDQWEEVEVVAAVVGTRARASRKGPQEGGKEKVKVTGTKAAGKSKGRTATHGNTVTGVEDSGNQLGGEESSNRWEEIILPPAQPVRRKVTLVLPAPPMASQTRKQDHENRQGCDGGG